LARGRRSPARRQDASRDQRSFEDDSPLDQGCGTQTVGTCFGGYPCSSSVNTNTGPGPSAHGTRALPFERLELRNIPNDPPQNRRMRDLDPTLRHHRHEVPITQPIRDVPAHAKFDDLGVEHAPAVDGVTRYRLGHSALPREEPESYVNARRCTGTPRPRHSIHIWARD